MTRAGNAAQSDNLWIHAAKLWLAGVVLLTQWSCDVFTDTDASAAVSAYKTIEWTELMPDYDLQALLNPPEYLNDIVEGSEDDQRLYQQLAAGQLVDDDDPYQRALVSTDVREEYNGTDVRIAGYLVPLEFDAAEVVTQAFLVPYFGACIHVPPPPPNQIILLNASDGVGVADMYNPYWISGRLSTTLHKNDVATSSYEMDVASYELYTE